MEGEERVVEDIHLEEVLKSRVISLSCTSRGSGRIEAAPVTAEQEDGSLTSWGIWLRKVTRDMASKTGFWFTLLSKT